ncbi:hypothetical protein SPI_09407 [Niveomyces insectorum RCEF 264]|uniref:Uncharacterized protein n=1 Tax=Niveomyces insectorum RCEF 264 TaxID=1081102 RepID=A0A167LTK2_9HYPO|nr:hypothetical protein SPI_09407 [Niveomyces insectorum RCEF 264]
MSGSDIPDSVRQEMNKIISEQESGTITNLVEAGKSSQRKRRENKEKKEKEEAAAKDKVVVTSPNAFLTIRKTAYIEDRLVTAAAAATALKPDCPAARWATRLLAVTSQRLPQILSSYTAHLQHFTRMGLKQHCDWDI